MSQQTLNCPECGVLLGPAPEPGMIQCVDQKHKFDIKQLLGAQSKIIREMLTSTVIMLDQQALIIQVAMEELMKLNDPAQQQRIEFLAACIVRTDNLILILAPLTVKLEKKADGTGGPQAPEDVVL